MPSQRDRDLNVTLSVLNTFLGHDNDETTKNLENNAGLLTILSERFMPGDKSLEQTLLGLLEDGDEEGKTEVEEFLQTQRTQLQEVAKQNVQTTQSAEAFTESLRVLKTEVMSNGDEENDTASEPVDYEAMLTEKMAEQLTKVQTEKPIESYETYQQICGNLGIHVEKPRGANDDDDEVEMDLTQGPRTQAVKCPITQVYMADAVINKQCGHVYSANGIKNLIANSQSSRRKCKCPVAGCTNNNVSQDQLKEDNTTRMRVKKAIRDEQRQKEQMSQQAAGIDVESDADAE